MEFREVKFSLACQLYLDQELLDEKGELKLWPAKLYKEIPFQELLAWCARRMLYVIPTRELVEALGNEINGRSAIEIGAGRANLGRFLDIPRSDLYVCKKPDIAVSYAMMGEIPVQPSLDVEELEALDAVEKYRPDVVIGGFITHRFDPLRPERKGFMYGVDGHHLLEAVQTYIMVGNLKVHRLNPLMEQPHRAFRAPWIITRAYQPEKNRLFIWNKR